jgi:hypothetical protein
MSDRRLTDAGDRLGPAVPDDWPAQAADTIVRVVGQVSEKTTGPVEKVARGLVYGLLGGLLGTVCAVLVVIAFIRILDTYVVGEDNTWLAYFLVGLPFTLGGGYLLFVKAKARPEP